MVEPKEGVKKIFYSWGEYLSLIGKLSKQVESQKFDFIVAVKRGGWIIGVILSHRLGVKVVDSADFLWRDHSSASAEKKVLVVDDVSDTGLTLSKVKRDSEGFDVKVATLFRKPRTKVEPDYYVKSTEKWIVFPYEVGGNGKDN